jgi:glycosyltransferase involved in cell wall biosynthesis
VNARCRLLVLASHPIQYFTPLYKRLARHPELDLEVLYYRDFGVRARYDRQFGRRISWDTDQLGGYAHRFLRNFSPIRDTFNPLHAINPGAFGRVISGADAIWLNGYTYPSNWFAAVAARLRNASVLLRSELRVAADRVPRRVDPLRDAIIRLWVARSDALLYIGDANRRAYLHYGAAPEKLFFSPYSADVDALRQARARFAANARAGRTALRIPDDRVVLSFVGKLTQRKHPEAVLELAAMPTFGERLHVVFAGSGPLEAELKARATRDRLANVTFLGFVNQSALPDIYAASDLFVMPSEREPWGIVLNEAMAAGAVPVVSDAVGAAADLIENDVTGYAFASRDWDAMRSAVEILVHDSALRERLSRRAMARSAEYSHERAAAGVVDALRSLGHIHTALDDVGIASAPAHAR